MKKAIAFLLLVALMITLCGCESIEQLMHPGQSKIAGTWVDDSEIAKFDFHSYDKEINAAKKGDTYCRKCDKYTPGIVRICSYCGQYIS